MHEFLGLFHRPKLLDEVRFCLCSAFLSMQGFTPASYSCVFLVVLFFFSTIDAFLFFVLLLVLVNGSVLSERVALDGNIHAFSPS